MSYKHSAFRLKTCIFFCRTGSHIPTPHSGYLKYDLREGQKYPCRGGIRTWDPEIWTTAFYRWTSTKYRVSHIALVFSKVFLYRNYRIIWPILMVFVWPRVGHFDIYAYFLKKLCWAVLFGPRTTIVKIRFYKSSLQIFGRFRSPLVFWLSSIPKQWYNSNWGQWDPQRGV